MFQPTQTRFLGCAHAADWTNSGRCGAVVHAAAEKLAAADLAAARRDLARDWAPFWRGCGNATQYLVAKDILTLYRAPLLRSIFGASRAAFVYVLRHPLAHCVVTPKLGRPAFHAGRCATDWGADEWARGGYSSPSVGASGVWRELRETGAPQLLLAGEAVHPRGSTVC